MLETVSQIMRLRFAFSFIPFVNLKVTPVRPKWLAKANSCFKASSLFFLKLGLFESTLICGDNLPIIKVFQSIK